MLRITVVESSRSAVTLRVEGRITGSSVEELRTACDVHTFASEVQLSLELADVSFADAAGILSSKNWGVGVYASRALTRFWPNSSKRGRHLSKSRVTKKFKPKPERSFSLNFGTSRMEGSFNAEASCM